MNSFIRRIIRKSFLVLCNSADLYVLSGCPCCHYNINIFVAGNFFSALTSVLFVSYFMYP